MKVGTVALIVRYHEKTPVLVESLSDDREIAELQQAVELGHQDPLQHVYQQRERQVKEDEEFGNYIEELLSQPFIRPEVQDHGVQWLKSKMRIEQYQKSEREATQVISDYAFKLYIENPDRKEFYLAGPTSKVLVRIFPIKRESDARQNAA